MRRLIAWNLMTLDGYFEGTKPWALDFHMTVWGDELEAYSIEQGREIGTLLFGRRTYEGMSDYWRTETGEVADMMNSIEKAVASRTLDNADWNNTRLLKGEVVDHIETLKAEQNRKDIFVFGSADLLSSLLAIEAVDEYRLFLVPTVLGAGTPLFKPDETRKDFNLLESRAFASGGILLRYSRKDT
jgi:dihydrofolate reductase